ncbi:uncharacterized protein B0P05DRAFT_72584 [Gilbertella persicaria]|uniref:uncharacterized protein n=1 Tax=Gilbertella persicaria TaxID=101096 RepID=UPI00221F1CF5|nr:uncharacterized protein B0P05DRAFT_72584 [Gilbertella persicaria]KAI8080763.1 hypothetical protein B0P05DRAFT_72584 [Gilbertella persicaria]
MLCVWVSSKKKYLFFFFLLLSIMMLRNFEKKRPKANENDVEDQSRAVNKSIGSNKSFLRNATPALSLKTNQKRSIDLNEEAQTKKQHTEPIERTQRHREEEIEWAPAGFDLDFSGFDSTVETYEPVLSNLELPENDTAIERRFHVEQEPEVEQEQELPEQDMSTIEYCPPKEKELPYVPDSSCIVKVSAFDGFADINAYELARTFNKDDDTFIVYPDDEDILNQLSVQPIADIEFDYDSSDLDPESDTVSDHDFSSIPFQDHTLDIEFYVEAHCH